MRKVGGGTLKEDVLQSKGPSDSAIPRALPPFFRKREIMSFVMGCMTSAGRIPPASLMLATSEVKMSSILPCRAALFLKVAVLYVSLDGTVSRIVYRSR